MWTKIMKVSTFLEGFFFKQCKIKFWERKYVPEGLNVHVNENKTKNLLFLEGFFFQAVKN